MTTPETEPAHESRIVEHPLSQLNIFKHEDCFAVLNDTGDIESEKPSPLGLYYKDTRYLSQWRVMIEHARMKLLNRDMDDMSVNLVSHLACERFTDQQGHDVPDSTVYLRREKFIFRGALFEKVTIENYAMSPVSLKLILRYDADFMDIFQARGHERKIHGQSRESSTGQDCALLHYTGLDNVRRTTAVRFSRTAQGNMPGRAEFSVMLEHNESQVLYFVAGNDQGAIDEAVFDRIRAEAEQLLLDRIGLWPRIETGDRRFDRWLERSRNGLCLLMTDFPTGPYPFAGIPWFCVPFGRDGIITAFQTLWASPDIARGVLGYLADTQAKDYSDFSDAEPGKILHETRQGEMAATGEVPFAKYYGSVDSTPLFVMLAGAYADWTGDLALIEKIWPNIEAALEWMQRESDDRGFLAYKRKKESGLSNQGWKDSEDSVMHADGTLCPPPIALCEVQGYTYAAWIAAAELAEKLGKGETKSYRRKADALYAAFNDKFWSDELGCYALALDAEDKPALVKASNNGHLLWTGIVPKERARQVVDMLMKPDMLSGWGIRTLTTDAPRYNPLSYHNGSVWPHDTAIAAAGMGRYGFYDEASQILTMLYAAARHMRGMLLPELFCGFEKAGVFGPAKYPAACILQAWACGAPFMALQGALGLTYDKEKRIYSFANKNFMLQVRILPSQ